jgi:protein ImuB
LGGGGGAKLPGGPTGVASISLRAPQGVPLEFRAGEIFTDDVRRRSEQFPALVERLSNRLGDQAVLRPQLQPDAQPEFAWRYEPWLQRRLRLSAGRHNPHISTMTPSAKPPAARPPCLKSRPVAAAVTSVVPEGPPLRFEWRHESHVVARAWGPERIETGWWRDCDVRRDYYLVETTTGAQFWLFRALGQQTWFIHGND